MYLESRGIDYPCSENKGADLHLCFHLSRLLVFPCSDLYICSKILIIHKRKHSMLSLIAKGPLTIWPVYAYTLAAQNTVIKLPMLILYTEDNSSMSFEETRVQIFTYFVIIW